VLQLELYNPSLNSRSNWSMFKDLKTQILTLPNWTLIVPNWTLIPNPYFLQFLSILSQLRSDGWTNNTFFNSKGNKAMSKDLKFSKSLNVQTLTCLHSNFDVMWKKQWLTLVLSWHELVAIFDG
jgi:hypothetical protein